MTNKEAIEFLKNMIDREAIGFVCPEREGDVAIWQYHVEALQMAISALQAQDEEQREEPLYCDRDICLRNEYNGIGCEECEVTKSQKNLQQVTTDTISRREAIDVMCELMHHWFGGDPKDEIREIKRELENLPSAQPTLQPTCNELEKDICVPCKDSISRQAAMDALVKAIRKDPYYDSNEAINGLGVCDVRVILNDLPSAQPEIIHCKECEYGVQDEDERWYCRSFGCQVGEEDGSGFCADAERKK